MKKCVNCKYSETYGEHKGRMMYYRDHMSVRKYIENDFICYGHPDIPIISQTPHWYPFNQKRTKSEKENERTGV